MITPKLKKPLASLTKLEREKAIKRLQAQNDELLNEMGQDSDLKALGTVQKYYQEQKEADDLQRNEQVEKLKKLLRSKINYQRYLCNILQIFLYKEDIPKRYQINIESNDEGIVVFIEGTRLHEAFKVLGIPKYDIHACKITAIQVGNTVATLEGYLSTKNGIIAPSKQEADLVIDQEKSKYGRSN